MSPESHRWKRAYTEDVESQNDLPRVELTKSQKAWLSRAWTHYFGFIPNGIPIYNEQEGFAHRPGIHIHWHHIVPIGEATRIDGKDHNFYNNPRNLAPICEINHTVRHAQEEDFIIHTDTHDAMIGYHESGRSSFEHMSEERKRKTELGMGYHNTDYDQYLLDLADIVVSRYEIDYPEDRYEL